jgi:tetratricopeptide (TPR) repeat protein
MPDPLIPDLLAQAVALHRAGHLLEAEPLYQRLLAAEPDHFHALHMLGVIRHQQGRNSEALELIGAALAIRPRSAWAHSNIGLVLRALKRHAEAVASFERARQLNPDDLDTINNLGGTLFALERYEEALAAAERALALKPDCAEAFNLRGNVLQETGRLAEALASYDRAITVKPDYAQVFCNRGNALQALNRHAEAIESYDRAVALKEDYADAHWNAALARLCVGDLPGGFAEFEWRWRIGDPGPKYLPPLWLGADTLAGRTILLYAEQGVGDCLQFARYALPVAERGAKVLLAVHRELKALLANLADTIFAEGEALPAFDLRCPLLSLPLAFGTTLATIPAKVPYVHADPERTARWRTRLPASGSPRVGLAWSGNPAHKNDHRRSLGFDRLAPLLAVPGVQFVSLQKEVRPSDAEPLRKSRLIDLAAELNDFADTAAVAANLDLIISVDTAVAHLAGAMGKPTWILLPFSPDWRWLLDREDSPWYPTARLFRQPRIGDWGSVIARVAAELQHRADLPRVPASAPSSERSPPGR